VTDGVSSSAKASHDSGGSGDPDGLLTVLLSREVAVAGAGVVGWCGKSVEPTESAVVAGGSSVKEAALGGGRAESGLAVAGVVAVGARGVIARGARLSEVRRWRVEAGAHSQSSSSGPDSTCWREGSARERDPN